MRNRIVEEHYKNNYKRMFKNILRRVGYNHALAEEIVQETYMRALNYFNCYNPDIKPFETWFNTILNNACRDAQQQEKNSGMSLSGDIELYPCQYTRMQLKKVHKAISEIKDSKPREVLELYFISGLYPRDIVKITEGTTIQSIYAIVKRFKLELSEQFG